MKKYVMPAFAVLVYASTLSLYASADDQQQPPPPHEHHKPPQVAIDACKNSVEKATCQFTGRNNEAVSGTCMTPRNAENGTALVCRPEHKDGKAKDSAAKSSSN